MVKQQNQSKNAMKIKVMIWIIMLKFKWMQLIFVYLSYLNNKKKSKKIKKIISRFKRNGMELWLKDIFKYKLI